MGLEFHDAQSPSREVDTSEVNSMCKTMSQHCEETNELYNLMARHIKKRGEERINLFTVEQVQEPDASGKNKKAFKMDKQATRSPNRKSTSRGNTPPRD